MVLDAVLNSDLVSSYKRRWASAAACSSAKPLMIEADLDEQLIVASRIKV